MHHKLPTLEANVSRIQDRGIILQFKMSALDWDSRKAYVLTEFTTFAVGATVLLAVATFIAVVVCYYYSQEKSGNLKAVLSLHRSLLRTVFWDTIKLENSSKGTGPTVTFSGLQPQSNLGKIGLGLVPTNDYVQNVN